MWNVEDNTGRRISKTDLNMEIERVTWCQESDSDDYSDYSSDTEEPEEACSFAGSTSYTISSQWQEWTWMGFGRL